MRSNFPGKLFVASLVWYFDLCLWAACVSVANQIFVQWRRYLRRCAPSPPHLLYVGVGWQRHCKACPPLLELDSRGTAYLFIYLFFAGRSQLVVELDRLCEVKNLYSAQGEGSYHVGFMVRRPKGSYRVLPLPSLAVSPPEIKLTH